jgi:hypothetical protein
VPGLSLSAFELVGGLAAQRGKVILLPRKQKAGAGFPEVAPGGPTHALFDQCLAGLSARIILRRSPLDWLPRVLQVSNLFDEPVKLFKTLFR